MRKSAPIEVVVHYPKTKEGWDELGKRVATAHANYLFFVYLFDKLCQAVRLAPGLDASEKLLHIGQGFQTAFASSAPSFHALDICVGILGAVLVRLTVYVKGKNAKKYRKGIEYGSARWGTAADIAPYVDPIPDWNIPLTRTESLTMTSRPKQPKYARNKNILVIGGSGSGKTRFFVKPSIIGKPCARKISAICYGARSAQEKAILPGVSLMPSWSRKSLSA